MIITSRQGLKFPPAMRLSGYNGYRSFGFDVNDAGNLLGTAAGSLIRQATGQMSPQGQAVMPYESPSWWDQQTGATKVLLGGAAFVAVAGGIAYLRGRKS